MTNRKPLDVYALAREVTLDSLQGGLYKQLIADGNTLYSPDPNNRDLLIRRLPSGVVEHGILKEGKFIPT
ncbi:MAG: hypothetical protein LAT53_05340 [Idiomarina sp.]|nr:hypothetical protein [Idiomarina sp.]